MDKTEKDKQLIKESIEHWERMIDGSTTERPYGSDCPLCQNYDDNCRSNGMKCPIFRKTGCHQCENTPWVIASRLFQRKNFTGSGDDYNNWQQAATKMRDWLKELYEDYTNPRVS